MLHVCVHVFDVLTNHHNYIIAKFQLIYWCDFGHANFITTTVPIATIQSNDGNRYRTASTLFNFSF